MATVVPRIMRRLDAVVEHVATGHDALARIKRGGIVLVLTARHGPGPRDQALGAGATGYLNKPFSIVDLMAQVSPLLRDRAEVSPTS